MKYTNIELPPLPPLTQEPILHLDMSPTSDLAVRILRIYRENCNCNWANDTNGKVNDPMLQLMNENNKQRAVLLDEAIKILESILIIEEYK